MDRRYLKRIRRYIDKRERIALRALAELDTESWFDYWHIHPDMNFKGNRVKPMFACLTYALLKKAESLMEHRGSAVQVWATLDQNTGYNAIYIHSENPNGTPFPRDFEEVVWGVRAPLEAEGIIENSHEIGLAKYDGSPCYYIRKRA